MRPHKFSALDYALPSADDDKTVLATFQPVILHLALGYGAKNENLSLEPEILMLQKVFLVPAINKIISYIRHALLDILDLRDSIGSVKILRLKFRSCFLCSLNRPFSKFSLDSQTVGYLMNSPYYEICRHGSSLLQNANLEIYTR